MSGDGPETRMDAALQELFHSEERVRLVYWRRFSGARSAVLLTGVVAVVAFVTGLSHLSSGAITVDGPLAAYVPTGAAGVVRLVGVPLGFVLGGLTIGLQRRLRLAWDGVVVALPLTALVALLTAETTDVLLLVVTAVALPVVVWNRDGFDQSVDLSPFQTAALTAFLAVQVYGTVGAYVLREQYSGIETWVDALYYIVVTGTTVGYGDATPQTGEAKLFTLSVLIVGTAAFTVAFGSLIVPALESRVTAAFGNMTASELKLLENHVLVLGYSAVTEPLLDELEDAADVVVVTPDSETASALRETDVHVLTADPTEEEGLHDARIAEAAGVVVAGEDDATDVLAVLAARQANPDVRIVAAAGDRSNVDKLERVGADEVISPTVIGGRLLGSSVRGDETPFTGDTDA